MKVEDQSPSPSNGEMLNQTQDPLERRRLQNRLSQRNHRRKIRERIAKLQERVIANELRAAAALHGWDQTYNAPYNNSTFNPAPYSRFSDQGINISQRDITSPSSEQITSFTPHYTPYSTQSWPVDQNGLQSTLTYTGDASYLGSPAATSPNTSLKSVSPSSLNSMHPNNSGFGGDTFHGIANAGECLLQDSISLSPSQPSYYVATEAALPQILQVINTMSPQSKVIVLVPPESSISTSIVPFMPPNSSFGAGFNNMETDAATLHSPPNFGCICYPCNGQSGSSAESNSKTWNGSRGNLQLAKLVDWWIAC
ncbi:unnamed protein product [Penicillium bialowiezense]